MLRGPHDHHRNLRTRLNTFLSPNVTNRDQNRYVMSTIATPHGPLRFVATHLGLSTHERRGQAKTLLDLVGDATTTTVVAGDFNDWIWVGSVRSALSRVLPACTRFRTFPSLLPMLRLDRIYCRPAVALAQAFTDRTARHISDHLPVIADVRISPVG